MKRGVTIADYLRPLSSAPTQCYLTNVLQVADVLEWVLEQVGRSTVWQTSFSISEEFLRRLYFIEKGGRVNAIHLILDFKATQKTLKLWPFLTRVIEHTYLADNHSKVILIRVDEPLGPPTQPEGCGGESEGLGCPDGDGVASQSNTSAVRFVSIITSQNLTRGNRMESAVVSTDPLVFDTFHQSLQDIIQNHSVPLSELFKQKIAE